MKHKTRGKSYTQRKGVTVKSINQRSYSSISHVTVQDNDVEEIEPSRKRRRKENWGSQNTLPSFPPQEGDIYPTAVTTLEVPVVKLLSLLEMDTATRVQTLDETDCISHSTNTLGKGINPMILAPAMGK